MSEIQYFWTPPDRAAILGMTIYKGHIIVATTTGIYSIGPKDADWIEEAAVRKILPQYFNPQAPAQITDDHIRNVCRQLIMDWITSNENSEDYQ